MSRIDLPSKLVGETISVSFDFLSSLAVGETLSSATVTATVYSGTDASPEDIISGSDTISGTKVIQKVTAGTLGVTYLLLCTAVTSLSQTLLLSAYLAVVPNNE